LGTPPPFSGSTVRADNLRNNTWSVVVKFRCSATISRKNPQSHLCNLRYSHYPPLNKTLRPTLAPILFIIVPASNTFTDNCIPPKTQNSDPQNTSLRAAKLGIITNYSLLLEFVNFVLRGRQNRDRLHIHAYLRLTPRRTASQAKHQICLPVALTLRTESKHRHQRFLPRRQPERDAKASLALVVRVAWISTPSYSPFPVLHLRTIVLIR